MSGWVAVGREGELAPGQWRKTDVDGTQIVVFNIDGALYAIEDVCTHDGGELASGELDGFEVTCPRHGARFDVRTGAARCPPAYEPTAKFPLKVEAGSVFVRDDRWD